ncbi:MAG: thiamine pyrophosphate-requiring protein [Bryobacteraceae bacterium]|nr:thiamine pyrophosphate-requiring protein [Bryobacteraceae bacterium]
MRFPLTRDAIAQSLPARFEQVAATFPDRPALSGDGRRWTYAALNRHANRIARAIRARTGPEAACIAFLLPQSPEMVVAVLGVLKAAKIYLGIHPAMPAPEQSSILSDAAPELLLTSAALSDRAREIAKGVCQTLTLDEIDELHPQEENLEIPIPPETPSTIFYTSGTTGRSKGVVKSHRAVMHRVWLSSEHDRIAPEDRQSLLTHCAFAASESDIFGALLQGAAVCVYDVASRSLSEFRDWIGQEGITLLHPPVLLFRRLLETLEGAGLFPSVRLVALAGDVVTPRDVEQWRVRFAPSCVLLHRFSTAETALLTVARFDRDSPLDPDFVTAGRPVADKFLTLVDAAGRPVASSEAGELVVRSRFLSDGYWRHPRETAAVFRPAEDFPGERIYRTGDLARFLPDGSLLFLGRREHLAKIRGFRVDAREVEADLAQLDGVAGAAVVVLRGEQDRLCAFVVMKAEVPFDPRRLREDLRARLPQWKIPARLESIPALPATLNGKVDRQLLARFAGREAAAPDCESDGQDGARNRVERELVDAWRTSLRVDRVGPDDNFLDLGGDSISAMVILNSVERRYGLRLNATTFFAHATVRRMAALIQERLAAPGASPAPAPKPLIETVADAFLDLLNRHGVDYIFANPGTDTAPILEAIAKAEAVGARAPELVLSLHESMAMAAAHGHFMVSGKPQVVMVHVDVGTQNIGANLHNAQRDRAGVVICAGRSPYTVDGDIPGGRNRYNHWMQEQYCQSDTVAGYVKWRYELTRPENLSLAVHRAFQLARAEPAGPVYLTLPREVLAQPAQPESLPARGQPQNSRPMADPASLERAAGWLLEADAPLILTAYAGRNLAAVGALARLAETVAAPVVESRRRVNFPSAHPLHLGFAPARYLQQADCVLIVDHDVPWVPAQARPPAQAHIIHVDVDPLKRDIPIWGFPVDLSIHGDAALVCDALAREAERRMSPAIRHRFAARLRAWTGEHREMVRRLRERAAELATRRPIAPEWAAYCLNQAIDHDTIVIGEAVTNSPALWSYLELNEPGGYFQCLGSGLGWGLGAALGAKLAAPAKTVVCVVGDGAWQFSQPLAAYWAAGQQRRPFLTVVFNNREYFATTEAILAAAPGGYARQSGHYPGCDLPSQPLIANIAKAMDLWARTVEDPVELTAALREAIATVREGRAALVDICIASPRPSGALLEE